MSSIILPAAVLAGFTILAFVLAALATTLALSRGRTTYAKQRLPAGDLPEGYERFRRNYLNLTQLPMLFFAVVAIDVARGGGDALQIQLAWAFVASRVAHSLFHLLVNNVPVRFTLFAVGALILAVMWGRLALAVI